MASSGSSLRRLFLFLFLFHFLFHVIHIHPTKYVDVPSAVNTSQNSANG